MWDKMVSLQLLLGLVVVLLYFKASFSKDKRDYAGGYLIVGASASISIWIMYLIIRTVRSILVG